MSKRDTYIWGAAEYGKRALEYCKGEFNMVGFVDRRAGEEFKEFCLMPVISPLELFTNTCGAVSVIIAVSSPKSIIESILKNSDIREVYFFDGQDADNLLIYKIQDGYICLPEQVEKFLDKLLGEWDGYSKHYSKLSPQLIKLFNKASLMTALPEQENVVRNDNITRPDQYKYDAYKYDMDLFVKLNDEYRSKPIQKKFNEYTFEAQVDRAKERLKKLSELCDLNSKKVLEIGCGEGYVSYCLAKYYNCDVTGLDIYESNTWEKHICDNLNFKCVDLSKENCFEEESFDLIISYVAYEHIRQPFTVLKESEKLLRPGGKMFIRALLQRSEIGSHLYRTISFPWPHLLFDDRILIDYALKQGVTQEWIDSSFYINKLTYSQYKEYFNRLNLNMMHENLTYSDFDLEFYIRFQEKLGLYPISDLITKFFDVLLEKDVR